MHSWRSLGRPVGFFWDQALTCTEQQAPIAHSKNTLRDGTLRANISETGLVLLINEQKGEKAELRDEREFSWCCSFPWGFGCRGTERRRAKRAAAQCSGSQSGRRSRAGAAGPRSSSQTEAADLHSGVQT